MLDSVGFSHSSVSRVEAAQRGLLRFYTGRPCKAGHVAERYVGNKHCVVCNGEKARLRERLRAEADPSYRMYRSVLRRSQQALLGRYKPALALGCGHAILRDHLWRQFTEGMAWERYGQWEVDHIQPLSAARSLPEAVRLCHFSNLQPLWKRENQLKGGA